jgi:uncharacterized protein
MAERPLKPSESPTGERVEGRRKKIKETLSAEGNAELIKATQRFFEASKTGDLATLEQFLDQGVPVDAKNQEGQTALMNSAHKGFSPIAELLIRRNADMNLKNNYGMTALMIASMNGQTEIAKLLIDHEADVDVQDPREGQTALILAVRFNAPMEVIRLLIQSGAKVSMVRKDGSTALTLAAKPEVAQLLLENSALVDHPNKYGRTPLVESSYGNNTDLLRVLIDHGATLDTQDNDGRTALNRAAANGRIENVRLLLEKGADPSIPDKQNRTALTFAQINKHSEVEAMLTQAMKERGVEV